MNGEMKKCDFKGEPEDGECGDYDYSKVKKYCVFYVKDFLENGGAICTAPPKEKKNE